MRVQSRLHCKNVWNACMCKLKGCKQSKAKPLIIRAANVKDSRHIINRHGQYALFPQNVQPRSSLPT